MNWRLNIIITATAFMTACSTTNQQEPRASAVTPPSEGTPNGDALLTRIGTLPSRTLEPGECGLFLWSRARNRQQIFFMNTANSSAEMNIDKRPVTLSRQEASEARPYGLFLKQKFTDANFQVQLQLEAEGRPGLTDGAIIPRGTLRLADKQGWEAVLPVAGILGCQTE